MPGRSSIQQRADHIQIWQVLRDPDASRGTRAARAQGLKVLGQLFCDAAEVATLKQAGQVRSTVHRGQHELRCLHAMIYDATLMTLAECAN